MQIFHKREKGFTLQNFSKKNLRGFTLIELLVVIAIIGILASIVLVSLSSARNKAKDTRIRGDMVQVRNFAEMIMSDSGVYDGLCTGTALTSAGTYGTQIAAVSSDIDAQNGSTNGAPACYALSNDFCVSVAMNTGILCISSNGKTGSIACAAATTACQ